jgi:hypothetical protein
MRSNRGTQTITETDAPIEAAPEATPQVATDATSQAAAAEKAKRAPRPAINVGEVTVRKSTRDLTDLTSRPSRITGDPVYLAVKAAEFGEATDIVCAKDKVEAVSKRLRTASDAKHLNVGMTIVPGNPDATDDEGNVLEGQVVVTFIKRQERATRVKAASNGEGTTGPTKLSDVDAADHNSKVQL